MNFWAGLEGQLYVRGNIYATDGVFNGIVKAKDFQLPSGDSMVSILNNDKKIKSDWLDLMGINVKDENGNTVMTIDGTNGITIQKGSIKWSNVSGRPSIPSLPGYVQSTYIDATKVESFQIRGNKIDAVCPPGTSGGGDFGFMLTGPFDGKQLNYLQIYAYSGVPPTTVFTSKNSCYAKWNFTQTHFSNRVDFDGPVSFNGEVSGIHVTLA